MENTSHHPKMDRLLISSEPHELRYRSKQLGVTQEEILAAKQAVGAASWKVILYLLLNGKLPASVSSQYTDAIEEVQARNWQDGLTDGLDGTNEGYEGTGNV